MIQCTLHSVQVVNLDKWVGSGQGRVRTGSISISQPLPPCLTRIRLACPESSHEWRSFCVWCLAHGTHDDSDSSHWVSATPSPWWRRSAGRCVNAPPPLPNISSGHAARFVAAEAISDYRSPQLSVGGPLSHFLLSAALVPSSLPS